MNKDFYINKTQKIMKRIVLLLIVATFLSAIMYGQCINCENTQNNGVNSSAIGYGTIASGEKSFASGLTSTASGVGSTTLGIDNLATGHYSITLGSNLKAGNGHAIVIGSGYANLFRLENNHTYSLMVGFLSQYPTLFVSTSPSYNKTGRIGIGNVTDPEAKLHIRSDDDEAATLYLQPSNWNTANNASIWLGNQNHGISADTEEGMIYQTEQNHVFKSGDVYIENIEKGIIMKSPDGRCWRGTLDNSGNLNFTVLEVCPGTPTSVPENNTEKSDSEAKVYPNPGTSMLTIQTKTYPCLFELYNANGQSVLTKNIDQAVKNIETGNLPVGVYTWIVTKEDKVIDRDKWIKASNIQ